MSLRRGAQLRAREDAAARQSHPQHPWQNDYLFASEGLVGRVRSCQALNAPDSRAWELSDHCPVVAEFELGTLDDGRGELGGSAGPVQPTSFPS